MLEGAGSNVICESDGIEKKFIGTIEVRLGLCLWKLFFSFLFGVRFGNLTKFLRLSIIIRLLLHF